MRLGNRFRLLVAVILGLAAASVRSAPARGHVSVGIVVGFAPPALPVYEQPICPGEGYIWTPGYWAWDADDEDYYWVPGTWVLAPEVGYLWTPGYWGWRDTGFVFHEGYWGPVVGFYGGINYGFGYFGRGYDGGRWDRGHFYYNRAVNHINVTEIHNVYNTKVVNENVNVTRVSYNGGRGGLNVQPTSEERAAASERHMGLVASQTQHIQEARTNRELRASQNHGKPLIAATQKPGTFSGGSVIAAKKGGNYNPPPNRRANDRPASNSNVPTSTSRPENNNASRPAYVHPNDLPKANRPDRPLNTGNAKTDQKYLKDQQKLYQKQEQDRQKLQQKQDQQHQRMERQTADDARKQQMEQRHQQQTQQMQQRHEQQQQKMEQRQQPRQQAPPHQQAAPHQQAEPHQQSPHGG